MRALMRRIPVPHPLRIAREIHVIDGQTKITSDLARISGRGHTTPSPLTGCSNQQNRDRLICIWRLNVGLHANSRARKGTQVLKSLTLAITRRRSSGSRRWPHRTAILTTKNSREKTHSPHDTAHSDAKRRDTKCADGERTTKKEQKIVEITGFVPRITCDAND